MENSTRHQREILAEVKRLATEYYRATVERSAGPPSTLDLNLLLATIDLPCRVVTGGPRIG